MSVLADGKICTTNLVYWKWHISGETVFDTSVLKIANIYKILIKSYRVRIIKTVEYISNSNYHAFKTNPYTPNDHYKNTKQISQLR